MYRRRVVIFLDVSYSRIEIAAHYRDDRKRQRIGGLKDSPLTLL